jgi:nucleotide-binding universal stress UspA family protein
MTGNRSSPCIVVGYDGSPASRAALRLAVDRVRGGKIFVVHSYAAPPEFRGHEAHERLLDAALTRGEQLLATAAEVDPRLARVDHELELIAGRPSDVIATVAETRGADEIIVGTRGFGPVRGMLGSVAHALLRAAKCPVTVIPDAALVQPREHEALPAAVIPRAADRAAAGSGSQDSRPGAESRLG